MCYMLYAGADYELPVEGAPDWAAVGFNCADWPVLAPRLLVLALSPGEESVRTHLHERCVVRVGSYEGCGCGFNLLSNEVPVSVNSIEGTVCRESRQALAEYVARNPVQNLYGCWAGDEELPSEGERMITTAQLADATFSLPERVKLRIAI